MINEGEQVLAKILGCSIVEGHDPRGAPCRGLACHGHPPVPFTKVVGVSSHAGTLSGALAESLGMGADPDDLAFLLTRAGRKVELVKFLSPGFTQDGESRDGSAYYRVRDVPTGRWYIIEAGSGLVFLADGVP